RWTLERRERRFCGPDGHQLGALALLDGSCLFSNCLVEAFCRWDKWREKKSLGSLRPDLFIVFTKVNHTIRQSKLFAIGIDNDQRRIFLVPLSSDAITPVFIGVIALNEGDGRNLSFFNNRRSYLNPAVVAESREWVDKK